MLNGKLYFNGSQGGAKMDSSVLCCDSDDIAQHTLIKGPTVRWSALTTYQGKLVLVGGVEDYVTKKLWSMQDGGTWVKELPRMPVPRMGATALNIGHHLLVAGGVVEGRASSVVEVFDGSAWANAEPLPVACYDAHSTLLDGEWYVMGGKSQGRTVFSAKVDALIATTNTAPSEGVWRILPEAPHESSTTAVFQGHLLAIGGLDQSEGIQ